MLKKLTRARGKKRASSLRTKRAKLESKRDDLRPKLTDAIVDDRDADADRIRTDLVALNVEIESISDAISELDQQVEAQRQAEADEEAAKQRQKKLARLSMLQKALNEKHAAIDEHLTALDSLAHSHGKLSAEVRMLSKQTGLSVHPDFMLDANRLAYRLKCACWKLAPWFAQAIDLPRTRAIHWQTMSTAAGDEKRAA